MTLSEMLGAVVEANLRLKATSLEKAIADERAAAEWAIFEPSLLITLASEGNERENTAEQFLSQRVSIFEERNTTVSAALEGTLPTGGRLRLGSQARRLDNNLQIVGGAEWETFSGVTLTQPVLKGLGWESIASQIQLAAKDSEVAMQDYRSQMSLVLSQAEMAYWERVAADEFVSQSASSVAVAETILKDNEERLDAGKTTEIEVLQAEAGLALRRSNLADAKQKQRDASARLAAFLGQRAEPDNAFTPVDSLETDRLGMDLQGSLAESVKSHPAYLAQMARLDQAGIRLAFAKVDRLPQLDLRASYGLNGLATTLRSSLSRGVDGNFPSWYVGLELEVPVLLGKEGRHRLAAADMRKQQSLLELAAIEIELLNGVSSLVSRVESLTDRVTALKGVVGLNRRLLDNEQEFLRSGKSESRKVLEAEEDLSSSELEALAATLELKRAYVELLVQRGDYLKRRGFEIDAE